MLERVFANRNLYHLIVENYLVRELLQTGD